MSRSTFNILFYANKGKEKNGIVPIMGRVTINGFYKVVGKANDFIKVQLQDEHPTYDVGREGQLCQGPQQGCVADKP